MLRKVFMSKKTEDDDEIVTTPTVTGTSDTHVNVFIHDVEDALKQAHAALGEVEDKYKALLNKLEL